MDKTQMIQEIERKIYPNNNGEITGQNLQDILKSIVEFAVEAATEQAGRKGEDGVGISNISMISGEGLTNRTLKITLTNNETYSYPIFDGKDGAAGVQGPKGSNGKDGKDGTNGIDGRNGIDGQDGMDGKDGKDGKDGEPGRDGRDGKDGQDGRDGRDGRDGQDGRDGEDGKDGKDGIDGKQGRTGAAIRGPFEYYANSAQTRWWCSGEEMEETAENAKWIDIILKDGVYYACKIGYYGRLSPWEDVVEDHWVEGESFEFVATKLLLSRNASIDFLTGNEIYLRDRDGNITAGAAGGNGVSFWAGAEDPSDGQFRVYYDGKLVATNAEVKGSITANSLTLGDDTNIEDYIGNKVTDYIENSGINYTRINEAISTFLQDNDYIQGQTLTGYVTSGMLEGWIAQWNASHSGQTLTDDEIEEMARRIVGSEISNVISLTRNPDGSITHTMNIGGREYSWVTYDIGEYVLLGAMFSGETESGVTKFIVSKEGLLQANNAIIYGKVYASEGYFHGSVSATDGYFRGRIEANEGFFNNMSATNITMSNSFFSGNVYANSLTLGNNQNIDDYIGSKITGYAASSGMNYEQVNQAIRDFLNDGNYVVGSALTGYVTSGLFESWIAEWNAQHSGQTLTDEEIEALAQRIVGAEISNVISLTMNPDGSITHVMNIGGNEYTWVTYDAGDYVLLGAVFSGMSGNELTKFVVSKDGLLQANNAIIYGKIYASEGYFHGSVSATDGYFKGSVSADNGYFKGDIVARSLKLGDDQTIEQYVDNKIASAATSGIDAETVNQLINDYLEASGITMDGYMTESAWTEWVNNWNATHPDNQMDEGVVSAIVRSELSKVFSETTSGGVTTHTALIGDRTYSWKTVDTGDYLLVDTGLGELNSASTGGFIISKDGLLQAYNALIYGKIYASEGYFKGSVSADNGYFRGSVSADNGYFHGDIVANSLVLGDQTIQDYVNGKVSAATGSEGLTTQDVNELISGAARDYQWVVLDDLGDYLVLGTPLGPDSSLTISKSGLLRANNAIISGNVYATDGVFNGTVYADNSRFRGSVSATDGYFKGSISADNGYFNGKIVANEGQIGNISITNDGLSGSNITITNNYMYSDNVAFKGSISADNGYFSGNVYANNGVFRGDVYANNGEFNGAITATSLTLVDGAQVDVTPEAIGIDTSQFVRVNSAITGLDGEVLISNRGLLQAKNAIISGSVFATDGYFKGDVHADSGEFRGSVSADSGYFKGDITANSLTLGGVEYDEMPSSLSSGDVNNLINQAATTSGWIKQGDGYYQIGNPVGGDNFIVSNEGLLTAKNAILSGNVYATNGVFSGTVYATNGKFKGDVEADSLKLSNSAYVSGTVYATNGKIENVTASTITATTFSATDSYFKGKINADSGYFKGDITANSLTLANNAYVSGSVYATNGKFENLTGTNLTMSNSFFSGNVYAENGYFKGDVTANSLTLANNASVSGTVYATSGKFNNVTATNFSATNSYFKGKIAADDGYFKGDITANSLTLGGVEYDEMPSGGGVDSGTVNSMINAAAASNGWLTTGSGVYIVGNPIGGGASSFTVSTGGLLTAKNAIISGSVYATNGVFNGKVYATGGEFSGAVKATSLRLGNNVITSIPDEDDFVKIDHKYGTTSSVTISTNGLLTAKNAIISGTVYANSGVFNGKVYATGGEFSGAVKATSLQLGNSVISSIPDEDDFVKIDHKYGTTSSVTISTNGLLTAKNAIVSGTIYANSGVFNGTVYADDGEFNGAITATSLSLGSNAAASVSGAINLDKFYKIGNTVGGSNSSVTISTNGLLTAKNAIISGSVYATNGYFNGKVEANEGYFKGNVSAENGYFKGELKAATGSFSGAITATSLYLGGQSVTGIPSTDGFLELGKAYNNMTVSTAGVLTAQNAVINGTVYANDGYFKGSISATNGHFSGIIDASDIILGGKSLRFSNGNDNTFEIANSPISIEYVPRTYYTESYDNWNYNNPTNGLSGYTVGQLSITGSSYNVSIPACNITVDVATYGESNTGQCMVCAVTWVTSSSTYYGNGVIPPASQCVVYSQSGWKTITGSGYANGTVEAPAVTKWLNGTTTGKTYYWGYKVWVEGYSAYWTNPYIRFSIPSECVTIVASAADDKQFVRIGSNGIQIFLGNGFYFTAANDSEQGQVISFAGKVGNAMKYFKLDSSGLVLQQ